MKHNTITYKTYKFNELKKDIKEEVLDKYRDINVDCDFWNDWVIEKHQTKLKKLGYTNSKIFFSGFWLQGDGACFEASVNLEPWLKAHKQLTKYRALANRAWEIIITIKQSGHYYHEYSMNVKEEGGYHLKDKAGKQLDEVIKLIESESVELAKAIYKNLKEHYECLISDEEVIETIKANDYEFLKDGGKKIFI